MNTKMDSRVVYLVSALKNVVGLGLGAPRAGPPDQLLPGEPDHFAAVFGGPVGNI